MGLQYATNTPKSSKNCFAFFTPKPILKKRSFSQERKILVSFRSPSTPFHWSLVHTRQRQTWTSVERERVNLILKSRVYIHPGSVSSCVVFAVHKLRWHVTRKLISRRKVTEWWWCWGVRGRSDIPIIEPRRVRVRVKLLDNSRLFSKQEKNQICDYNWMNGQSHVGRIISGSKSTALVCTCFWFCLQKSLFSYSLLWYNSVLPWLHHSASPQLPI